MPRRAAAGDLSLQAALQRLGARRVEATLVAALSELGPLGTRDIVERTGLRQPEVSVGMQVLRSRDWVAAEAIPREGKGRPMHRYRLSVPAATVRRHYEALAKESIAGIEAAADVVRKRLG